MGVQTSLPTQQHRRRSASPYFRLVSVHCLLQRRCSPPDGIQRSHKLCSVHDPMIRRFPAICRSSSVGPHTQLLRRGNIHMVIACAASPAKVTLPSLLSHSKHGQSPSLTSVTKVSSGTDRTAVRNGSAKLLARRFIPASRSRSVGGTSSLPVGSLNAQDMMNWTV